MTLFAMKQAAEHRRSWYSVAEQRLKTNFTQKTVYLSIQKKCTGDYCRVLPGLMGEILVNHNGEVLVVVNLEDLEKAIENMEKRKWTNQK